VISIRYHFRAIPTRSMGPRIRSPWACRPVISEWRDPDCEVDGQSFDEMARFVSWEPRTHHSTDLNHEGQRPTFAVPRPHLVSWWAAGHWRSAALGSFF
jgi:hypothetical protein